ncbi:MAG: NAD(P)(+) transhydrogenase (Re/Si-specific) subunit beta [Paraburkholderia graminis]|uniref:NAD(P) transhydrogenase subunit beta n=1 Tax=Paraburkholderia graminis TaxID=60548 RepID=A0ABD5CKA2_9BURK|nr:NAD(P)(+) transhydrogenase (Re/Si-specific) subunit beta [Paraburkholderia graminis]MDQ0624605.1 NAD(P) transhydrogenase subunit beta [Paraburkholderia graminis]MDR6205763.1 NAD(P) transhydrogenase subunit beta [Paraburkholderia graminis]
MPQASDSTVWLGMLVSLTAACAALLACALGPMLAGASVVRRRNLTRRPALAALLASGMGLSVVSVGVARYLSPGNQANLAIPERIELYAAVFAGALIFAASAIAFCKLRGLLPLRVTARRGHDIVNAVALLLCGWLGYGFVTEAAQPFGLTALLAMSALASSIGVHVMMSREYSKKHAKTHAKTHAYGARADMPMKWREDAEEVSPMRGMVRAAAYRHGRRWHNSDSNGSRQRDIQACAARRLSNRSTVSRHP